MSQADTPHLGSLAIIWSPTSSGKTSPPAVRLPNRSTSRHKDAGSARCSLEVFSVVVFERRVSGRDTLSQSKHNSENHPALRVSGAKRNRVERNAKMNRADFGGVIEYSLLTRVGFEPTRRTTTEEDLKSLT